MQDRPDCESILAAVATFLRETAAQQLDGHAAFEARVAAAAVDIVRREIGSDTGAAEQARLAALLGSDGTLADLTRELAERIRAGAMDASTPGLLAHLEATTLDKLAVDQPGFAATAGRTEP